MIAFETVLQQKRQGNPGHFLYFCTEKTNCYIECKVLIYFLIQTFFSFKSVCNKQKNNEKQKQLRKE